MNSKIYKIVFKDIEIGYIQENVNGDLFFKYYGSFKSTGIRPIPHFPKLNKTYKTPAILKFLINRIPPKVFKKNKFSNPVDLIPFSKKIGHSPVDILT
tara:strand:- start:5279 stop:5572 length:294 start_codon:yes stop_codon:yes gene_type:complete